MTAPSQTLLGLLMLTVGGLKTLLHMGTVPILTLPTCNGKSVDIALSQSTWFEHVHCWGCYALAAGLVVAAHAVARQFQKRRTVASIMD